MPNRPPLSQHFPSRIPYESFLACHLLPEFGTTPIAAISRLEIRAWAKRLAADHAPATVTGVVTFLSTLLGEAVEDKRIPANPCHRLRLKLDDREPERPVATPAQVALLAAQAAAASGDPGAGLLVFTAAYTGMRWGELTGLHRDNCKLATTSGGRIVIDPNVGALHEVNGRLFLGPPKSAAAVREVALPAFLTDLLIEHLDGLDGDYVFVGRDGGWWRRSNFARRHWRPATDGRANPHDPADALMLVPVIPGMHFHDLRHTHNTWLIEDDIPRAARMRRLGHKIRDVHERYSHTTPAIEHRITTALQTRYERAA